MMKYRYKAYKITVRNSVIFKEWKEGGMLQNKADNNFPCCISYISKKKEQI